MSDSKKAEDPKVIFNTANPRKDSRQGERQGDIKSGLKKAVMKANPARAEEVGELRVHGGKHPEKDGKGKMSFSVLDKKGKKITGGILDNSWVTFPKKGWKNFKWPWP